MNDVLISDPFLFPPSGEDTHPFGGTYEEWKRREEVNFAYQKKQFDVAWETVRRSESSGSTLFDAPYEVYRNINYLPDSPESLASSSTAETELRELIESESLTEDDMNADQFLGTRPCLEEGSMSFGNIADEVAPSVDELSYSLGQENLLDSPQLFVGNEYDDQVLFDLDAILNGKTPEDPKGTSDPAPNNESFSDQSLQESSAEQSLQESSVALISPGSFGIDIPSKVEPATPTSTIDQDVVVKIMKIDPPSYDDIVQSFQPKRRNGRKTSLTARQCSESPQYDFQGANVKTEPISPDTTQDIKPAIGTKRARKNSTHAKSPETPQSAENKSKRIKLYEMDDPAAKNARAAYLNRQKKKEKMTKLTVENQELESKVKETQTELERSRQREKDLEKQLQEHQKKTQAATGLNRILLSAKEVLETVMVPLHQRYGPWNLQVAPWFRQVEAAMSLTGEIPASLGGNNITSKFITLHLNAEDRVAMVDYRPDVPILPKSMPQ